MATDPNFARRQRERMRDQKRKEKVATRAARRDAKGDRDAAVAAGEDPDLAGIVAGPQPHPFLDDEAGGDGDADGDADGEEE